CACENSISRGVGSGKREGGKNGKAGKSRSLASLVMTPPGRFSRHTLRMSLALHPPDDSTALQTSGRFYSRYTLRPILLARHGCNRIDARGATRRDDRSDERDG